MGPSGRAFYPSAKEVSREPSLARAAGARSPATAVATIVVLDGSSERQVRDFRDYSAKSTKPPKLGRMKSAEFDVARLWRLEFNSYLDAPKALLKVLKHFMSTNCSLINSTSKLCRVDERVAKRTFLTLSLEPVDGLVNLLATFRARHFQRQIVEKHGLIQTINKIS
jgi:hypothetical protein